MYQLDFFQKQQLFSLWGFLKQPYLPAKFFLSDIFCAVSGVVHVPFRLMLDEKYLR